VRGGAFAAALVLAGCASSGEQLREPRLTNPPRMDEWFGDTGDVDEVSDWEARYGGAFRLPLTEEWTWELPDEGRWALARLELSTPVVHEDRVYVGSSRKAGLFALDRISGLLQAVVGTRGPVQSAPLRLDDGWLVADTFGQLQRYDDDWKPVWAEPRELGSGVYRPPLVDSGRIYISTASDEVQSIDLATGQWQWTARHEAPRGSQELAILGAPAPVKVGDELVAGFSDGAVRGLDPASGRELWRVQVGTGGFPDVQAEAVLVDDTLVVAAFGGPMIGLDPVGRTERWRNTEAGATSTMAVASGWVYAADAKGRVLAVDAATGEQVWSYEWRDAQFGPPVRAGGTILVGDVAGTLFALDRFEGKEQWRHRPMDGGRLSGVAAAPAVVERQVLFPSAGGTVHSLIAQPGDFGDPSEEPAQRADRVLGW
jgi:outer membrane protein assembly factor BamB